MFVIITAVKILLINVSVFVSNLVQNCTSNVVEISLLAGIMYLVFSAVIVTVMSY